MASNSQQSNMLTKGYSYFHLHFSLEVLFQNLHATNRVPRFVYPPTTFILLLLFSLPLFLQFLTLQCCLEPMTKTNKMEQSELGSDKMEQSELGSDKIQAGCFCFYLPQSQDNESVFW